ncbi:MAG: SagB/ThcOx family dehydrogenase [Candidatus Symbiothrix sp.]|jgi:nitroreductase|nr:SagB/ThcOx family dehydrogenase [Candidatus Symbiothrix sp.]
MNKLFFSFVLLSLCVSCTAQAQDIQLPAPQKTGGKPLMEAFNDRQSNRNFSSKDLSLQTIADLAWAAYGLNRENKRTVPSSQDRQEIDLYISLQSGIYFYEAKENKLILKVSGNHQAMTGKQPFVTTAPLNFIFVANLDKASNRDAALTDCGFISQNIYLFCASEGLITVVRGSYDKDGLHKLLTLNDKQEVLLTQTVGYQQ